MIEKRSLQEALVAVVEALDATAGSVSQMLGDVLLQVVEHVPGGGTLRTGQGYLVSDYPVTQDVLSTARARIVSLADDDPDEAEARLLAALGYDSLLMLPLLDAGAVWGLVEIYAVGRRFEEADARRAETVLAAALG